MNSFVPYYKTGCELSRRIPVLVADLLEIDRTMRKRFREETVTDLLVAALLRLPSDRVVALMPDETKTGSDFDIVISDAQMNNLVQYRIQAKRLSINKNNWEISSYRELAHPKNTGNQCSTLLRSASHEKIPTIPLYAFYNQSSVCQSSGNKISGIELAHAVDVRNLIKSMGASKKHGRFNKRIEIVRHHFFPFNAIFCRADSAEGDAPPLIISPLESRRRVEIEVETRRENFVEAHYKRQPYFLDELQTDEMSDLKLDGKIVIGSDRVDVGSTIKVPKVIQDAFERRREELVIYAKVPRPRIILCADEERPPH